ncbi:His Kinase A (phospho-acceptor) domain-containing protein [Noviherbaspirillum humi]|uniref:histidine kinase n=1 Tax=Noviherbaspirillum humi TaxID=1688639 RepID=A0A239FNP1_9BURK|nr:sensor histidine kinase [Noviherbaspirillum humi]SNS57853.1 His Kinase A (phospho-acceptor) domain-containing protein [Noviherbaspirillum humi]
MSNKDQRLAIYFFVAIVVFAMTAGFGYRAVDTLVENQRSQVAARLTAIELQTLLGLAVQAETGQRGFVITGREEYLEPYADAKDRLPRSLLALRKNLAGNPSQLARIDAVEKLQAQKFAELDLSILTRRASGFEAAQKIVLSDQGRRLMEEMRANVRAMEQVEVSQLNQRIVRSAQSAEAAFATIAVAGAINVGLLVFLMLAVRADARAREQSARQVAALNQSLEQRVLDRTQELGQANAKLQDANHSLEAFSYTVAHDLRAPLRGVQGFAEAVLEDYADRLDITGQDYLRRICRAAQRMEGLIEDLLAYSRLARSDLPLEKVPLEQAVNEALGHLQAPITESRARIQVADGLPMVVGNWAACVQVLQNLLSNAIKFRQGDAVPEVRIAAEIRNGAEARVWVCDNGIGIPAQHQERIFAPFERLHSLEEYSGTGIGLAIVAKAVSRMKGACGVESEPGGGSRFWFDLPLAT